MFLTLLFGQMMFDDDTAGDEDEAIVDDCYEAATDASDYAGSVSGGDRDNDHDDHDEHSPPEFYDDQPGSEVVDDGEDEALEVPEYVPPDDVPLDDPVTKAKVAQYEEMKRMFNRGKGARNSVGTLGPLARILLERKNSWYASRGR